MRGSGSCWGWAQVTVSETSKECVKPARRSPSPNHQTRAGQTAVLSISSSLLSGTLCASRKEERCYYKGPQGRGSRSSETWTSPLHPPWIAVSSQSAPVWEQACIAPLLPDFDAFFSLSASFQAVHTPTGRSRSSPTHRFYNKGITRMNARSESHERGLWKHLHLRQNP